MSATEQSQAPAETKSRATPPGASEGGRLIRAAIVAFVVTCGILVVIGGRLAPASRSEPGFRVDERARASSDGTFQVTLDATDHEHRVAFDFSSGSTREAASAGPSDLIVRRHNLGAPHGALRIGRVPLESAVLPPNPAWQLDAIVGGEVQNPALQGWYSYSYWSHLLASRGEVYAVRLGAGGVAFVVVRSYYCEPENAGCLTLRYRLEL